MAIIRKKLNLPVDQPMFVFANKVLPSPSKTMGALYDGNKDNDEFLYVAYATENTF